MKKRISHTRSLNILNQEQHVFHFVPKAKPLLTRADLPLDAIAEICRRWGVRELAVDPTQVRPPAPGHRLDENPLASVDLYLIADFGRGKLSWGFKKQHWKVADDLENLLGCPVWIEDKDILKSHIADGREWAQREMDARDVIYSAE